MKEGKGTAGAKVKLLFPVEPYAEAYILEKLLINHDSFSWTNKKLFENKKKSPTIMRN